MSLHTESSALIKVRVTVDSIDPMCATPNLRVRSEVSQRRSLEMKERSIMHAEKLLDQLPVWNMQKYLDAHLEISKVEIYRIEDDREVMLAEFRNPDREKKQAEFRKRARGFADACMNGADPNGARHNALDWDKLINGA